MGEKKVLISEDTKVTINLVLLIIMFATLLGGAFRIGKQLESYDSRIFAVEQKNLDHAMLYDKSEANSQRLSSQDVKLAEIQTDLKWIRTRMEETD